MYEGFEPKSAAQSRSKFKPNIMEIREQQLHKRMHFVDGSLAILEDSERQLRRKD